MSIPTSTSCSKKPGAQTPNPESETVWESEVLIEDVKLLARFRSQYNLVQVLELSRGADHPLAGARVLLLDRPGNIQSVYDPYKILTNAYYDVLASLPPILPQGPLHTFFGKLTVHIGDALGPEAMVDGGFAGIIVDLFSKGAVLPSLQQTETWERMKQRLRPGGRIMVNCGGSCVESESKKDGGITMEETIATLARVFPGQLSKRVIRFNGDNCIALTGPIPDLRAWMRSLQKPLLRGVFDWETVE
ncbi:hypothetical protein O6H91_17G023800 [Diphasiastrum complanatum]|uniref:Uncharacterized protein n=1 Tax=Diphasiastrum complanatum TaxID=34168 RepID=A0ACC2B641_DIPCM|nr:hypothetical protein O6H91_17G023800 [Diphasiastrum complanatum]